MSESKQVAPTRAEFRSLKECKSLGEAFQCAEFLDRIKQSAPAHVKPSRMLRTFIQATSRTPDLLKCNMRSVLGAMLTCSEVGLEPNTPLMHAFLIPFGRYKWNSQERKRELLGYDVQLIFGYPGLLDLAYRSGHVTSVHADVVWPAEAKDEKRWSFAYGTEAHLRHVPSGNHEENEKPVWVYAHANLEHGQAFEAMPWADVMRIRNQSQGFQAALRAKEAGETAARPYIPRAWTDAPWVRHEVAMAKKTAFRSLWKWLPHSVELAGALALDEQQDRGMVDFGAVIDGESSVLDGGLPEGEEIDNGETRDGTAAFGLRDTKTIEDGTKGATQDEAGRSPPQTSASPPVSAPAAAPKSPPVEAAKQPAATSVAPQSPSRPAAKPFRAWLVDGDGEVIPDEDGRQEEFADPVEFAHAYINALKSAFPADFDAIKRANEQGIVDAQMVSTAVAPLLVAAFSKTPERKAPATTESPSLPMEMPHDPDVIPAPTKPVKAEIEPYLAALKARLALASKTGVEAVNAVIDRNTAVYTAFPPKWRIMAQQIAQEAQQALTGAPAATHLMPLPNLAAMLIDQVNSLATANEVDTWRGYDAVRKELDRLNEGAPDLYHRVIEAADARREALTPVPAVAPEPAQVAEEVPPPPSMPSDEQSAEDLRDEMLARVEDCKVAADVVALGHDAGYVSQAQRLHKMVPAYWGTVSRAALARKAALGG